MKQPLFIEFDTLKQLTEVYSYKMYDREWAEISKTSPIIIYGTLIF